MEELKQEIDNAIENYKSNKKAGAPAGSLAFDSGRVDGLRQALEILENSSQKAI